MPETAPTPTVEELLAKATQPAKDAMVLHPFYRGKVEIALKCCVRSLDDFAIWYTPGVAASCRAIAEDPELVYEHTHKWNTVAVVSDGTRVLGLGDIGPKAGLPVMEGKALLYKYLGGVDAWPIMLDTKDPDKIIETVLTIQPGFGGVNLEDIAQPKCFRILDTLRAKAEIPIWHDDQQGTATVTLAGADQRPQDRQQEDRRRAYHLRRIGRFQCRLRPVDLRRRRRPLHVLCRRQQRHPAQGPPRYRAAQGGVRRQVEDVSDHQRRRPPGRHPRSDGRR